MFLNLLPEENKKDFMILANSIMMADGVQAEEELSNIDAYCRELNIEKEEYKTEMLDDSVASISSLSFSIKKAVYLELYALAVSDNDFDDSERELLKRFKNAFEISDTDEDNIREVCDEYITVCNKMNSILM